MVQRVPELVWWREKETGWSRQQRSSEKKTGPSPEQRSSDRERGIDRSWWTVESRRQRERESMREMGKF
jgi:hypothetical protein